MTDAIKSTDGRHGPEAIDGDASRRFGLPRFQLTQESIVFLLTTCMFIAFSVVLKDFLTSGNVITLLRNVSVLGMLGLGMSVAVIGRGIDLSMIATLVVGMGWALKMTQDGHAFGLSLVAGAGFVVVVGLVVGCIVAYAEIPAVFTTLAMGPVIFGFGNAFLFSQETFLAPGGIDWLRLLGYGSVFGVPIAIYVFIACALIVYSILRLTRFGRTIYAIGDNPAAARLTGFPVRFIIVGKYVFTSLMSFLIGLVIVASNSGINTRLFYTTFVYDVVLVVVLGGIGLSGGRGGVRNVVVGTLFVGTLLTGMTIMDLSYTVQNLVKSLVMLAALIVETFANPRDEQTSQQGDI
ncbi:ABC transporter permease [Caballeronia sp. GAWG1-1]|uniref:ABC transporter permease n=1 Tax=Caballeronia sp. GAWG1-1 TaxID=2921742 RepID=UPI002028ACEE|nr:ABC transporter permease [Caballeronia sp. GAWG1-1]